MEKKKILVLPGGLQIGGAERVAANLCKYAPEEFEFHYLVFDCHENAYGCEIEAKGGKVIAVPLPNRGYGRYIKTLSNLMKAHRYAAVHSHTMFNSGLNLAVAKWHGVPVRIAHSHTTKTEHRVSPVKHIYTAVMRGVILATATHRIGCGVEAGNWLFGRRSFEKSGFVLRNGIDTQAFSFSGETRNRIRSQYGLENAFVIGHTGTLLPVKNQSYLIDRMPAILKRIPNAVLMLVGGDEGDELSKLQEQARRCGVSDRVHFAGPVLNVNEYLNAFDVFAFPSRREGTPLALLEAQTNGLPCIVSKNVPEDAFLTDLITTVPLEDPDQWVERICTARRAYPEHYPDLIREKGYDARYAYNQIYRMYHGAALPRKATVCLSFDDGRGDNTWIFEELLIPRRIPATLNVTTGYVDGTCPTQCKPTQKQAMTVEDVVRLADEPLIELALHGDRHQNTPQDILEGRRKLIQWLGCEENAGFGFASPRSALGREQWESEEYAKVRAKVLYMRASYRIESCKLLRDLCRKAGRILPIPCLYRIAYAESKMAFRDRKMVYSACVLKETTFAQVKSLIDLCIQTNTSVTLMFHSILPDCGKDDVWSWDEVKFVKLCDYLVQKRGEGLLDICTTKQMYEKMQ